MAAVLAATIGAIAGILVATLAFLFNRRLEQRRALGTARIEAVAGLCAAFGNAAALQQRIGVLQAVLRGEPIANVPPVYQYLAGVGPEDLFKDLVLTSQRFTDAVAGVVAAKTRLLTYGTARTAEILAQIESIGWVGQDPNFQAAFGELLAEQRSSLHRGDQKAIIKSVVAILF